MPAEQSSERSWYLNQIGSAMRCIRRDRAPILAVTALALVAGCIGGKVTNVATSTAQLVLTPLPSMSGTADKPDALGAMISPPMDVKTATLLCLSDEAVELLAAKLNDSGKLAAPVENLWALKNSLDLEITIEYETPYATQYSPIVQLTAEADSPELAKLKADAWAQTCVELAARFRDRRQSPTAEAFTGESLELQEQLDIAEEEMEAFWRENSLELYQQRANELIGGINSIRMTQVRLENELAREQARQAVLGAALEQEKPTRTLRWTPSPELAGILGAFGASTAPAQASPADGEAPRPGELVMEQVNPLHDSLRTEVVMARATLSAIEAEKSRLADTLANYQAELEDLQAKTASLLRIEKRITRETDVVASAYSNAAAKLQFAKLASELNQPPLQVLSLGGQWPLPRFRRAILFGFSAAIVGFAFSVAASVVMRRVLEPALELSA